MSLPTCCLPTLDSEQAWNGPVWIGFLWLKPWRDLRCEWEEKIKSSFQIWKLLAWVFLILVRKTWPLPFYWLGKLLLFVRQSSMELQNLGARQGSGPGYLQIIDGCAHSLAWHSGLAVVLTPTSFLVFFSSPTSAQCSSANICHSLHSDRKPKRHWGY